MSKWSIELPHTNIAAWAGVASSKPKKSWTDRAELAASFLRVGDAVCDLGAGAHTLKMVLPEGIGYIPVDCTDKIPGTYVCDFNDPQFQLPAEPYNVVTALGVLNYLLDLDLFMNRLSAECHGKFFIFTYDLWKLDERYKGHGVRNSFDTLEESVYFFSKYIKNLAAATVFRRRVMFTGTLGTGEPSAKIRTPLTRLACEYIRPQEYLALKIFKINMMPRCLA